MVKVLEFIQLVTQPHSTLEYWLFIRSAGLYFVEFKTVRQSFRFKLLEVIRNNHF